MIHIGIIDDDAQHQKTISLFIKRYEKEEHIYFKTEQYMDGLNFIEEYKGNLDIVFWDIEMPHMDGMETARELRKMDSDVAIVFVTNMAQYAIQGYEVDAIDFIVKPISYYVFKDKLEKAMRSLRLNKDKALIVHDNDSMMKIKVSQILYIEKNKNYLIFHTMQGEFQMRGTMADLENKIQDEGFSKCINGCLVNFKYVSRISKDSVWIENTCLPISRQRKKKFKEDFMRYLGGDL